MSQWENPEAPHALRVEEVLEKLHASREGMAGSAAAERQAETGPNALPEAAAEPLWKRFFKHFHDTLIYILIAAAAATAILGHWIDTWVILAVVLINATIGFVQEGKAEKALAGIRQMLSPKAVVRRDGEWKTFEATQLVPGDLVRLRSGDRVPADLRLIETQDLRVEESALTGESDPVEKSIEPVAVDAGVGDRTSMAFSGSLVSGGRGIGLVVAIGEKTEMGRINRMLSSVETLATPLTRQMNDFSRILSVVIVGMAVLMFVMGWLLHPLGFGDLFLAAIGFAVAAIPEGLPAVMSITLAIGVQRMAARKAITRRLNAVETLGSVTVICSDKTGTLTKNEMTAREVVTAHREFHVCGTGYEPVGKVLHDGSEVALGDYPNLHRMVEIMTLCNDASLSKENDRWMLTGEPTEGALIALSGKLAFQSKDYERIGSVPFESYNKWMATLHRVPGTETPLLFLKGAPDRVLKRCTQQLDPEGNTVPIKNDYWEAQIEALSEQGLRVLAAAYREFPEDPGEFGKDGVGESLVFAGLVGIVDPPRPEAIEAIRICREAGIAVKMITGDHATTALAIAREMGIPTDEPAVTGAELESADDETMKSLAASHHVFARTSPEHKLRLVTALQAQGEVVAMTGDGVNDAPALKRADVGVAMGIKGTEATKEVADIVLADDNFASIEKAVEEGRTIYANLRKSILFILPTNGAQSLVIFVAVMMGFVLPLTPVQVLWVNMVVAVTLALGLAFEPAEPGVMQRPPRDPKAGILTLAFIWRIAFVSVLIGGATIAVFLYELSRDTELALSRSIALNVLVIAQAFYLLNARFMNSSIFRRNTLFSNPVVWLALAVLLLLQLALLYTPFLQTAFDVKPIGPGHWLLAVLTGLGVFLLVELEKFAGKHFRKE